jgi:hypothetical protein
MTTRSTMKSYAKVIQMTYETSASVDFRDTGVHNGALIECNYFKVDCRSNGTVDAGYFIAQPSGMYLSGIGNLTNSSLGSASGLSGAAIDGVLGLIGANTASSTGSHGGAGIGGVIGTADGSVEMSLASNQKTTGIMLFNKLVGTSAQSATVPAIFVVTYGNIKWANSQRDQDDLFYPPGN